MNPTVRETYLSVGEVAVWLNLSESSVRDAAAKKRLPATRVSGVWRFLESELRVFLDINHTQAVRRLSLVPRHGGRRTPAPSAAPATRRGGRGR